MLTLVEARSWLTRSLEDRRLSRHERQEWTEFVSNIASVSDREALRAQAFEVARIALTQAKDSLVVLEWFGDVTRAILHLTPLTTQPVRAEAYFSPGDDCPRAIERLLASSTKSIDLCVFTITDDRLADAILAAHRRGVRVRIITDDAKADDLGSDVNRFTHEGIALRVDQSPFHMHHKFALFDGTTLLTGSYNWTRGAARDNEENLVVTTDPRLLTEFQAAFDRLWSKLSRS